MSIRLFNNSGGYIDLNAGGDGTAANTFTLPAETGTLITTAGVPKAALPAGSVLQVVNATYALEVASSTDTFVDTGLTASITPTSASSKILVLVFQNGLFKTSASTNTCIDLKLLRGATNLLDPNFIGAALETGTNSTNVASASVAYLDSPATTSSTTYKTQFRSRNNTAAVRVQYGNLSHSTITLMEIAA
jgi:hypothetical protein